LSVGEKPPTHRLVHCLENRPLPEDKDMTSDHACHAGLTTLKRIPTT